MRMPRKQRFSRKYRALYLALPHLAEDPPLSLGESDLAKQLLPDEQDKRRRGLMLQRLLNQAIDSLLPPDTAPPGDLCRRAYHILVGEYRQCRTRAELERALSLSQAAYSRGKRRGIFLVDRMLPHLLSDVTAPPTVIERLELLEQRIAALERLRERAVGDR